jgi:predicted Zn-dependent protease
VAGFAAFAAAAAFDWVWQIGAVPVVALLLAAIAVSGLRDRGRIGPGQRLVAIRLAVALTAAAALWAIVVPLASTVAVRRSQAAAAVGDWAAAARSAADAQQLEPSAATPRLQRALLLESVGAFEPATRAIEEAVARQPTDASLWVVASRIAIEADRPRLALAEWRRAGSLDPTWPIFAR